MKFSIVDVFAERPLQGNQLAVVERAGALPADQAAALVGLGEEQLSSDFPVRLAEVGPKFVLIGVRELAVLKTARLNEAVHQAYLAAGLGVQCVFVFSAEPYQPDAQFAARMFFESGGVRGDPATGSANSAFAAYLMGLGWGGRQVVVDQGVEIKRPSRLYLDLQGPLRVGGRVQPVAVGSLAF